VAADRRRPSEGRRVRQGAELGNTHGELTLVGSESWDDLSPGRLVRMQEQHRHRVQRRAVAGLMLLLGVVLPLGALAMIGVGMEWSSRRSRSKVLAITLTPSLTGWLLAVRWAFRPDGRGR
jgi:hypothetical protein